MTLTSEQILGARGMLRMDQRELAELAGVTVETLRRIEDELGPSQAMRRRSRLFNAPSKPPASNSSMGASPA
jgi:DNA-binding XRE family transcriptional regulator